jgi:hypothetical protein
MGVRADEFQRAVTAIGTRARDLVAARGPLVICAVASGEATAGALSGLGDLAPNAPVIAATGELPAFVDGEAIVVAIGRRGEPAPHDLAEAALDRGAQVLGVVEIGSSPELYDVLDAAAIAEIEAGPDGLSLASIVGGLTQVAVGRPQPEGLAEALVNARAQIERRESTDAEARELARRMGRTFPYWLGATGIGAAAAEIARQEVNLRLKTPAFAASLPQATFVDVAGFGLDGDVTRQIVTLIHLATPDEPQVVVERIAAAIEILRETVADVLTVEAQGADRLSSFCDLVIFGEQVARAAAIAEGLDPGPVPVLDDIARAMGAPPSP